MSTDKVKITMMVVGGILSAIGLSVLGIIGSIYVFFGAFKDLTK